MGQCCIRCCAKPKYPQQEENILEDEDITDDSCKTTRNTDKETKDTKDTRDTEDRPRDEPTERDPLLSKERPVVKYDSRPQPTAPPLFELSHSPVYHNQLQQADVYEHWDDGDVDHRSLTLPVPSPPASYPVVVQLEPYHPAPCEMYHPAQREMQSRELPNEPFHVEQERELYYLPQHESLASMSQLEPSLSQSDKSVVHKELFTPPVNLLTLLSHDSMSNLHEVSPLPRSLENKSSLSNSMSYSCDYNGGVITSNDGVKLIIPEGAIMDGDFVKFYIATDLYGRHCFTLPSHCQADLVSPYYWIGVSESYHFQKPITVQFEHYGACDPLHYQLLSCEDDDESYTMRPVDYDLRFDERSQCTFQTNHFCSYCLFHNCKDPVMNRIGAFYLKPKNFQNSNHSTVEIWFSFPISHCMKRNEELYKMKGLILDTDHSCIFEASSDKSSTSYFALSYDQDIDGWCVRHFRFNKISTKEVNFYNYCTDFDELKANEAKELFPPRFIINVEKKTECSVNLSTEITITLCNSEERKSAKFQLCVLASITTSKDCINTPKDNFFPSIGSHCCDKNVPELKDLLNYSKKISPCWKDIATQLGIPEFKVITIDLNHPNDVESKCRDMLTNWLQKETSPCWCHFIQALSIAGLNKDAENAKRHVQNSYDNNVSVTVPTVVAMDDSSFKEDKEDEFSLQQLVWYLREMPQGYLQRFVLKLLPHQRALNVIRDIRRTGGSREDILSRIGEAFLKEKDPSWAKVYNALREAECNNLADIIETCFLPLT